MTAETVSIAANGLAFTADLAGPADADVVLLLHGFPQTRHTWRAELRALGAAGFRACAPDQRGYSAGARPAGIDAYRSVRLVADALALADALGAERFHLVGHDWGGQLAWLLAAQQPERVRSLSVLSRPHPAAFARAMADDPEQATRSRHHRAHQRAEATDWWLADGAARLLGALRSQGVPEADVGVYLATLGERAALDAAIHWYRAAGSSGLAAAEVPPVAVPTLYVWGAEDATVGRRAAEGTRAFVNAPYRFVELPGVGHFVTDQAPDAFPPLLLEHLKRESVR
ncbi:MAG TPA: alpha/beta fold hydrolase [Myxococcota bacterium]|nr:alpha/beta fold hydrolase [Myxococcota bacterium]